MDEDISFERERRTREEYRSQNGLSTGQKVKKERKGDTFLKITLVQAVVCTALLGLLMLVGKMSPDGFNQLKTGYNRIMERDMSVKEVWAELKDAAGFIFESAGEKVTEPQADSTTEIPDGMGNSEPGRAKPDSVSFSPYYTTVSAAMPVEGRISSPFGWREDPFTGEISIHTGLDIACDEGTPIAAAFYGKVEESGENDVAGKYIRLSHAGGLETFYCHCSEILAPEGAVIRQGETIALVGSTGMSTGAHLHFEVRIGGKKLNPEWLLYGMEV